MPGGIRSFPRYRFEGLYGIRGISELVELPHGGLNRLLAKDFHDQSSPSKILLFHGGPAQIRTKEEGMSEGRKSQRVRAKTLSSSSKRYGQNQEEENDTALLSSTERMANGWISPNGGHEEEKNNGHGLI
ncbi:hypothetical protein KM043_009715 [Ampulex compressa]|nr:hypothetical protein KM043_009715 [Ampulex compressa]